MIVHSHPRLQEQLVSLCLQFLISFMRAIERKSNTFSALTMPANDILQKTCALVHMTWYLILCVYLIGPLDKVLRYLIKYSGVTMRVFWNEINLRIRRLSKAYRPWCDCYDFNQLKTWLEEIRAIDLSNNRNWSCIKLVLN